MGVGSSKGLYNAAARQIRQGFVRQGFVKRISPDFTKAIPSIKRREAASIKALRCNCERTSYTEPEVGSPQQSRQQDL
jgi:hypothetical protein